MDEIKKAIYVKLDDYKDVMNLMNSLKAKLVEAKEAIEKIKELKNEEETEIELWNNSIAEIEGQLAYIDKSLFEPEE